MYKRKQLLEIGFNRLNRKRKYVLTGYSNHTAFRWGVVSQTEKLAV